MPVVVQYIVGKYSDMHIKGKNQSFAEEIQAARLAVN